MILKPTLQSWRAFVALSPFVFFIVMLGLGLIFAFDWRSLIASGAIVFWLGFGVLLVGALAVPFMLFLSERWEIQDDELIHRFAHEVRRQKISSISSFGPPVVFQRAQLFFRGSRPRALIVGDKVVDRMLLPYLYKDEDLNAFLNELKSINPAIRFDPRMAKQFWT